MLYVVAFPTPPEFALGRSEFCSLVFRFFEGLRSEYPKSSLELVRLGMNLSLYVILFFADDELPLLLLLLFPGDDVDFGLLFVVDSGLRKIRFSYDRSIFLLGL